MSRMVDHDKMIREEWFKDHRAAYSVLDDGQEHKVERLYWARPGSSFYSVLYLFYGGTLFIAGDLGEAVYRWHPDIGTLKDLAKLDLDYFKGKCCASEVGRDFVQWDEDKAAQRVREWLREERKHEPETKAWSDFLCDDGREALNHKDAWLRWLEDHGHEYFGDDWWEFAPNFGQIISIRCRAHLIGIKMAFHQLKD